MSSGQNRQPPLSEARHEGIVTTLQRDLRSFSPSLLHFSLSATLCIRSCICSLEALCALRYLSEGPGIQTGSAEPWSLAPKFNVPIWKLSFLLPIITGACSRVVNAFLAKQGTENILE
jgi:hypothetical protein